MKNVVKRIHKRVQLLILGFGFLGLIAILQILNIQFIQKPKLMPMDISYEINYIPAVRGNILSRDGQLLATTKVTYDIYFDPLADYLRLHDTIFYNNVGKLAQGLARMFGDKTAEEYKKYLLQARKDSNRYVLIHKGLSVSQYEQIKRLPIFNLGYPRGGLIAQKHLTRVRPFRKLAARAIGYFSYQKVSEEKDNNTVGIEAGYNAQLTGTPGRALYRRFQGKLKIKEKVLEEPENGSDVISTLDMNLQYFVENALEDQLRNINADMGVAIVMDVKSGDILAMANLKRSKSDSSEYYEGYNYAIGYLYEVGSVMKPFVMLALFEEYPNLDIDQKVFVNQTFIHLDKDFVAHDAFRHALGYTTLEKVVAYSSNVGVIKLVTQFFGNKVYRFINRLEEIGVSRATGIDIPGEKHFSLKDPSERRRWWHQVSLAQISIGYEHLMTPIQVLALYNAIANGGLYVTPHLGKAIVNKDGEVKELKFNNSYEIASEQSVKKVQKLLEKVVEYGTASRTVKSKLIKIAGKTGTAKILGELPNGEKGYLNHYNTTFVGYFPADNPKYSVLVMIHDPLKPGHKTGATAAGPVFKQIAEYMYRNEYNLHPKTVYKINLFPRRNTLPTVKSGFEPYTKAALRYFQIPIKQHYNKAKFVKAKPEDKAMGLYKLPIYRDRIPSVVGMSARDASFILESQGLRVKLHGRGKVVRQSKVGSKPVKGQTVELFLN